MVAGMIVLWYGSIGTIPAGYVLCDGNNGTPDLRNRFVPGAGGEYNPGDTGGAENHNHHYTGDGHSHSFIGGSGVSGGVNWAQVTGVTAVTGDTGNASSKPRYHSLAYIMKT